MTLTGRMPSLSTLQIPLPLKPRHVRTQTEGGMWEIRGVHPDGQVEPTLQLIRRRENSPLPRPHATEEKSGGTDSERTTNAEREGGESEQTQPSQEYSAGENALQPFFRVERTLALGLNWQARTQVSRLTPVGSPVVISVPLLQGESVTTAGIRIENGRALIHLKSHERETAWDSSLEAGPEGIFRLQAPVSVPWTETWILDASPIWHCELWGIPIIHHQDQSKYWRPQWRPWPGEAVEVRVTRPSPVPGQMTTIDRALLEWKPGMRFSDGYLTLRIRSSQGGQHKITLPENAQVQAVKIDGRSQPISPGPGTTREIAFPLHPGAQEITMEWHQDISGDADLSVLAKSPMVDLGQKAVNATVQIHMPPNRWILWAGGPRLGPAVLFWSTLFVVLLASCALSRNPWTPLKTHHWLLLGLGLAPVEPLVAILIVGWLLALGFRGKRPCHTRSFTFNLLQLLLVVWTFAAMAGLYDAVKSGLLGIPNMQIAGNESTNTLLRWTQDRIDSTMPNAWVLSLPLFVYRILMLLWALWLAQALIRWLRWGWHSFNEGGLWRKVTLRRPKIEGPSAGEST